MRPSLPRLCWRVPALCLLLACAVVCQLSTTVDPMTSTPGTNCTSVNATDCEACSPGTHSNNDTESCFCCSSGFCVNSSDCVPCASGFYQPQGGQVTCLPCPPGLYTNTTGSVMCQSCQPGYFTDENASVSCIPCEKGHFASQQNALQCEPCPNGAFCNTTSCTQCTMCPDGQESLAVGSIECSLCRPGMYKGHGDDRCKYCKDGDYQVNWGGERCEECPVNHYCPSPDIGPILCPDDAFCPAGSMEPSYCMETFLSKDGESCSPTPFTITILVVCAVVIFLGVLYVIRKQRLTSERRRILGFGPRSPLLHTKRSSSSLYGITYDAEPVYAGW
ncbi:signal peptide, CUB and EGF-like domain-containing protein 1 isoform X1 [Bufo bufo]|uniref:signal peptide, CUB and EGF-like domain-containing protein 1 isoform X1 n=1 Tax=Bufo bufo TaxID=8384 RepID=UPI001ABDABF5|nr:signal peptide, CUB and EGF-like domain-containing protein 1 isoform X1 [Bufo bufo]